MGNIMNKHMQCYKKTKLVFFLIVPFGPLKIYLKLLSMTAGQTGGPLKFTSYKIKTIVHSYQNINRIFGIVYTYLRNQDSLNNYILKFYSLVPSLATSIKNHTIFNFTLFNYI